MLFTNCLGEYQLILKLLVYKPKLCRKPSINQFCTTCKTLFSTVLEIKSFKVIFLNKAETRLCKITNHVLPLHFHHATCLAHQRFFNDASIFFKTKGNFLESFIKTQKIKLHKLKLTRLLTKVVLTLVWTQGFYSNKY